MAGRSSSLRPLRSALDGWNPTSTLIEVNGSFFGTTQSGGIYGIGSSGNGYGSVFRVTPSGEESLLHSFKGGPSDGSGPSSLIDVNGTLYGTTAGGGTYNKGTVFALNTSGRETILYSFRGGADGAYPRAALRYVNGTLYGTASSGGSSANNGVVFAMTLSGAERVIHRFNGLDGQYPAGALIDVNGTLYGTTEEGGADDDGTVFQMSATGRERVLYSFRGGADGRYPAPFLVSVNGGLVGSVNPIGSFAGSIFSVSLSGKERTIYGGASAAGLILSHNTLYGAGGGGNHTCYVISSSSPPCGTVFKLSPSGAGFTILHSFDGSDGAFPAAAPIYINGVLYGTTSEGGLDQCGDNGSHQPLGCGIVYEIGRTGNEQVLHYFSPPSSSGLFRRSAP